MSALIAGDPDEAIFREQLAVAQVKSRERKGMALYVVFDIPEQVRRTQRGGEVAIRARTLGLKHPNLEAGGTMVLWLRDGRMTNLECYTIDCNDWPSDESTFEIVPVEPPRVIYAKGLNDDA